MATATLPPPLRLPALSAKALKAFVRQNFPCESTDPFMVDAYERVLDEWAARASWQRDLEGFQRLWQSEAAMVATP